MCPHGGSSSTWTRTSEATRNPLPRSACCGSTAGSRLRGTPRKSRLYLTSRQVRTLDAVTFPPLLVEQVDVVGISDRPRWSRLVFGWPEGDSGCAHGLPLSMLRTVAARTARAGAVGMFSNRSTGQFDVPNQVASAVDRLPPILIPIPRRDPDLHRRVDAT
jgi:hypothetical protein